FSCPSRRASQAVITNVPAGGFPLTRFLTDYAGNAGTVAVFMAQGGLANGLIVPLSTTEAANFNPPPQNYKTVIGYPNAAQYVRLSNIKNGASNTIFFGEKYVEQGSYATGEPGWDDVPAIYSFSRSNVRMGDQGPFQD